MEHHANTAPLLTIIKEIKGLRRYDYLRPTIRYLVEEAEDALTRGYTLYEGWEREIRDNWIEIFIYPKSYTYK